MLNKDYQIKKDHPDLVILKMIELNNKNNNNSIKIMNYYYNNNSNNYLNNFYMNRIMTE